MSWQAEVLIDGEARGAVLRFDAPVSFWGGIDPVTSKVTLAGHPQQGQAIAGTVLVIPRLIGSSSSSSVLLELLYRGNAPKALILGAGDAILPVAGVVAGQMDWPVVPILVLADPPFASGDQLAILSGGKIARQTAT